MRGILLTNVDFIFFIFVLLGSFSLSRIDVISWWHGDRAKLTKQARRLWFLTTYFLQHFFDIATQFTVGARPFHSHRSSTAINRYFLNYLPFSQSFFLSFLANSKKPLFQICTSSESTFSK